MSCRNITNLSLIHNNKKEKKLEEQLHRMKEIEWRKEEEEEKVEKVTPRPHGKGI